MIIFVEWHVNCRDPPPYPSSLHDDNRSEQLSADRNLGPTAVSEPYPPYFEIPQSIFLFHLPFSPPYKHWGSSQNRLGKKPDRERAIHSHEACSPQIHLGQWPPAPPSARAPAFTPRQCQQMTPAPIWTAWKMGIPRTLRLTGARRMSRKDGVSNFGILGWLRTHTYGLSTLGRKTGVAGVEKCMALDRVSKSGIVPVSKYPRGPWKSGARAILTISPTYRFTYYLAELFTRELFLRAVTAGYRARSLAQEQVRLVSLARTLIARTEVDFWFKTTHCAQQGSISSKL